MFISCVTFDCSTFDEHMSDVALILSGAGRKGQVGVIRDKYLFKGLSFAKKKVVITFFERDVVDDVQFVYYDDQGAHTFAKKEYDLLPQDALSLTIRVKSKKRDFVRVDESIRNYILYRQSEEPSEQQFHIWDEIFFDPLTEDLAYRLGFEFLDSQIGYRADVYPQKLYSKRTRTENNKSVPQVVQVSVTTSNDYEKIEKFLQNNKNNKLRLAIFNAKLKVGSGAQVAALMQKLATFDKIEFIALIHVRKSIPKIEFILYDPTRMEMVASNFYLIDSILVKYLNLLGLTKLQIPVSTQFDKELCDFKRFVSQQNRNIHLLHAYFGDRDDF